MTRTMNMDAALNGVREMMQSVCVKTQATQTVCKVPGRSRSAHDTISDDPNGLALKPTCALRLEDVSLEVRHRTLLSCSTY